MNYQEALDYIEQLNTKGIALGLERITALMELLGNPQNDLRCIHVAGTNGKGSVCAFIDSALQSAGLRVGRYISPTLYDYLERFQINGAYITEQEFAEILTQVRVACETMAKRNLELPTVFEVETAVAFLYFKRQRCDYVLLEVGMGGRLDSTNVITHPLVSVITSISLDHTGMLGNTLAEIAYEKAGIIKPGAQVVLAPQDPEAMEVLYKQCIACGITPHVVHSIELHNENWSIHGQTFSYGRWQNLLISLIGTYQRVNVAVALETLQLLQQYEPNLTDETIRIGLAKTIWRGRFEVILDEPLFVVDGAHNPAGAKALADTIEQIQNHMHKKLWLMMGVFRDKEYRTIGEILHPFSDTLICFQPPGERGLEATVLETNMKPYYETIITREHAEDAVQYVLTHAAKEDMIISFGSLSTIKAVEDAVKEWEVQQNERNYKNRYETN